MGEGGHISISGYSVLFLCALYDGGWKDDGDGRLL